MKRAFKTRLKKLITILLALFVALFFFRLFYGFTEKQSTGSSYGGIVRLEESFITNKNYASKKYQSGTNSSQASVNVDQKYEKIAEINTKTSQFDQEERQVRTEIEKYNSLIQFEKKSGNEGYRQLSLMIGVPPENFDSLYLHLCTVGRVQAKQITKKDKTNEYKELNAKKVSLEKIRNALIDLKAKGGQIEEYMKLENRILEIEQQLQELGVSLGNFDDENEFCTVQLSLKEENEVHISLTHRIKVALEWTIKFYLRLMSTLAFVVLFAYLFLLLFDKIRGFTKEVNKTE